MHKSTKVILSIFMLLLYVVAIGSTFVVILFAEQFTAEAESQEETIVVIEEPTVEDEIIVTEVEIQNEPPVEEEVHTFYEGLCTTESDRYLLAKMVMAEAEGESLDCKKWVASVILNRVKDDYWPNTVEEVIFQKAGKIYQFSPIGDGRWNRVEPNTDCYEAVDFVLGLEEDMSQGATYFEACANRNNWHSRNLMLLYEVNHTRFYRIH